VALWSGAALAAVGGVVLGVRSWPAGSAAPAGAGHSPSSEAEEFWQRATGSRPTELQFPGRIGTGRWRIDPGTQTLELVSTELRLIQLGQLDGRPCRLQVDLHQPSWTGGCGIFLGYRQEELPGEGSCARFQLIELRAAPGAGPRDAFRIQRRGAVVYPSSGSMPTVGVPFSDAVQWPSDQPQRLVVELDSRGMNVVSFGGWDLSNVRNAAANRQFSARDYSGAWGLYQMRGTVWCSRPTVEFIEERTNGEGQARGETPE
jgi:hypothetical protein